MSNKSALQMALESVEMSQEAQDAIARLTGEDLEQIDQSILAALDSRWKQAGLIAAGVMISAPDEYEEIPEAFYILRMRTLAQAGRIEVKGDLDTLKSSEVRLAA